MTNKEEEELEDYRLCYNEKCKSKKQCGHYHNGRKKDGGFIRFIGNNDENKCRQYDEIK